MALDPTTGQPEIRVRAQPITFLEAQKHHSHDVPDWLIEMFNDRIKANFLSASAAADVQSFEIKRAITAAHNRTTGYADLDSKIAESLKFFAAGNHFTSLAAIFAPAGWGLRRTGHTITFYRAER